MPIREGDATQAPYEVGVSPNLKREKDKIVRAMKKLNGNLSSEQAEDLLNLMLNMTDTNYEDTVYDGLEVRRK